MSMRESHNSGDFRGEAKRQLENAKKAFLGETRFLFRNKSETTPEGSKSVDELQTLSDMWKELYRLGDTAPVPPHEYVSKVRRDMLKKLNSDRMEKIKQYCTGKYKDTTKNVLKDWIVEHGSRLRNIDGKSKEKIKTEYQKEIHSLGRSIKSMKENSMKNEKQLEKDRREEKRITNFKNVLDGKNIRGLKQHIKNRIKIYRRVIDVKGLLLEKAELKTQITEDLEIRKEKVQKLIKKLEEKEKGSTLNQSQLLEWLRGLSPKELTPKAKKIELIIENKIKENKKRIENINEILRETETSDETEIVEVAKGPSEAEIIKADIQSLLDVLEKLKTMSLEDYTAFNKKLEKTISMIGTDREEHDDEEIRILQDDEIKIEREDKSSNSNNDDNSLDRSPRKKAEIHKELSEIIDKELKSELSNKFIDYTKETLWDVHIHRQNFNHILSHIGRIDLDTKNDIKNHQDSWEKDWSENKKLSREDLLSCGILGRVELDIYQKKVSEALDFYSKKEKSLDKDEITLATCTHMLTMLESFAQSDDNQELQLMKEQINTQVKEIQSDRGNIEEVYKKRNEGYNKYLKEIDAAYERGENNDIVQRIDQLYSKEVINPYNEQNVKRIENILKRRYREATKDMTNEKWEEVKKSNPDAPINLSGVVEAMAIVKDILTNRNYCHKIMVDLQEKMRQDNVSLDEILQIYEKKYGFEKPDNVTEFLYRDPFNKRLLEGKPFRDYGAGDIHGPHSHRLQMFILFVAHNPNLLSEGSDSESVSKAGGILKMNPREIYKLAGDERFHYGSSGDRTIWNDNFDAVIGDENAHSLVEILKQKTPYERKELVVAYSSPLIVLKRILTQLPPGPLKKEAALTKLYQEHFGQSCVIDEDSILKGVKKRIIQLEKEKMKFHGMDKEEIEAKTPALEKELENQKLPELEKRYASFGRIMFSDTCIIGSDYLEIKESIIQKNKEK